MLSLNAFFELQDNSRELGGWNKNSNKRCNAGRGCVRRSRGSSSGSNSGSNSSCSSRSRKSSKKSKKSKKSRKGRKGRRNRNRAGCQKRVAWLKKKLAVLTKRNQHL